MRHSLHTALHQTAENLKRLEEAARKMPNQNFADIVNHARGRVLQLTEHPDLDTVHAMTFPHPAKEPQS